MKKIVIWLFLVVFGLTGCGVTQAFIDLPAPSGGLYPTVQIVQTIGDTQNVSLQSPVLTLKYGETGSGAGSMAYEAVTLTQTNINGTMLETSWGDWLESNIKTTESYDPDGKLIEGRVLMNLPDASILQWFGGCFSCTIDRSRLILQYIAPEPGREPVLSTVYYLEEWGLSSKDVLALGQWAVWENPSSLFPGYTEWGFWENTSSPFTQVTSALSLAKTNLKSVPPTLAVRDEDSIREIIGRQSGLQIYQNGNIVGQVLFTYKNNWGRMPNTEFIGKGALSRVEITMNDSCYAVSVLSPALSPRPTSLFVFEDCGVAEAVENTSSWTVLYDQIRNEQIPGVYFAIYANGYIGKITSSTSDGPVDIGEGGGVFYSVIGQPVNEDFIEARQNLSFMGLGGIKASGFYYATSNVSGNGIDYYLATLILATAPEDLAMRSFGHDIGVLDRVGMPTVVE
ncbi:MAG: hypothetical protein UU94_C0001G0175 [Candidatus Collierbacteria bacterium GW2011_GWB2_42_12]|nr:MAG: hypothetical protein UU94_C0001G0175 [Candidatus Collierbacteria bacterium GW2011_GWB2_42_12]